MCAAGLCCADVSVGLWILEVERIASAVCLLAVFIQRCESKTAVRFLICLTRLLAKITPAPPASFVLHVHLFSPSNKLRNSSFLLSAGTETEKLKLQALCSGLLQLLKNEGHS